MKKLKDYSKMKSNRQYKDAALGAFIGWIGILLMCILMVIMSILPGCKHLTQPSLSTPQHNEENGLNESGIDTLYEDEHVMWIGSNGDTIWE